MTIQHISDNEFETQVLKSDVPVLVDYWAEWCAPCKSIGPILEELAGEYSGRLKLVKLNIDDNQDSPAKFGVRAIPTLMIFKAGEVAATTVGAVPKSQLRTFIDNNI